MKGKEDVNIGSTSRFRGAMLVAAAGADAGANTDTGADGDGDGDDVIEGDDEGRGGRGPAAFGLNPSTWPRTTSNSV